MTEIGYSDLTGRRKLFIFSFLILSGEGKGISTSKNRIVKHILTFHFNYFLMGRL